MPDRVLLSRARSGDKDAVADLYSRHIDAALKYARAISASTADAEDLVAESFTRVITQLAMEKGPDSSFRAYLFTTMRHRLYSQNRHEYTVDDMTVLDMPVTDRDPDGHTDQELLKSAFDTLTPQEQEVLLLLDVHELRPAEVGQRLGLRPSALSMRATRARSALAEAYLVAHLQPAQDPVCESVRQNLGRYVRGTASATRARRIAEHVQTCDRCCDSLLELTEVNRALRAIPIIGVAAVPPRGVRSLAHRLHSVSHLHGGFGPLAAKAAVVVATVGVGTSAVVVLAAAHTGDRPSFQAIAPATILRPHVRSVDLVAAASTVTSGRSAASTPSVTAPPAGHDARSPVVASTATSTGTKPNSSAAIPPTIAWATPTPSSSPTGTPPFATPTPTASASAAPPSDTGDSAPPTTDPPPSGSVTPTPTGSSTTDPATTSPSPTPTAGKPCSPWFPGCWLIVWFG